MNADLHMADDLKNTGKGNLFVIFGEPDIEILPNKDGMVRVKVKGVDVFHPSTGEVRSDGADGVACWFIDTDYNEEFLRSARVLSRRQRPLQCAQDDAQGGDQRRRVGDAEQRYVPPISEAEGWADRRQSRQPPRG